MKNLIEEITKRLIGMKINECDYTDELIIALNGLDVAVNTVDFGHDRIYKINYDDIDQYGNYCNNWDDYYICSLDVEYLEENQVLIKDIIF